MAKYEIMLLVSGKLSTSEADKVNESLKKHITAEGIETKFLGTKELAYPINHETTAHYYQLNFDGGPQSFFEWRRLTLINKSVLRHLIVNLEKDYGWRAINNEKKVRLSAGRKAKYDEIMNNPDYVPTRTNQHPHHYRHKKRDEWTLVSRIGENGPEDVSAYNNRAKKNRAKQHDATNEANNDKATVSQTSTPTQAKVEPIVEPKVEVSAKPVVEPVVEVTPTPVVEAKPVEVVVKEPAAEPKTIKVKFPVKKTTDDKTKKEDKVVKITDKDVTVKLKPVSSKVSTAKVKSPVKKTVSAPTKPTAAATTKKPVAKKPTTTKK